MNCLNSFNEKLDFESSVQPMTEDHLMELELVMNEFEKSTFNNDENKNSENAKFVVDANSEKKISNGVFYLQDLATALKVAKNGDKIFIHSGNYVLNKTTENVKKSIQIHGSGQHKTTISVHGLYFILS